jgi:2-keto-4-pentenoate hydratase/2-oxohepta-3-ene-1,7-dioic acid hydratase in catechol pathway
VVRGAAPDRAAEIARAAFPPSLTQLLSGGDAVPDWMARLVDEPAERALVSLDGVQFLSPADPSVYRDFSAFDEHAVHTWRRANRDPPPVTRERPVFFKGSTQTLIGHDAVIPWPYYAEWLDCELELGLVVKRAARDVEPAQAADLIFGVTMLNDLSARDVQFHEMTGRLGPAKGKDFATSVGPWLVTLDELNLDDLKMSAWLNGERWSLGNASSAMWSFPELVAWTSTGELLSAGDLLGTGTVGGGSGLELDRRLSAGDVIELRGAGVGTLRNAVGPRAMSGYMPTPKQGSQVERKTHESTPC